MFPNNSSSVEVKITWRPLVDFQKIPDIEGVFQNGETIAVKFSDGDVVTSKPMAGDQFDPHTGVAMCIAKKYLGSRAEFQRLIDRIKVQS